MPPPKTFFDHQQEARRRSAFAQFLFFLTVAGVVAGIMGIAALVAHFAAGQDAVERASIDPIWLLSVSWPFGAGALVIILIAWLLRVLEFSKGPEAVMRTLGGRQIHPGSTDPDERRLLNLVEEMSIASGVPVPDVYVLDEAGINACAVGVRLDQAAVGVTRGAMQRLERDELQGVIAHEFSHILHGDMALNTRLIGWLAGLFTISQIGYVIFRLGLETSGRARRRNEKEGDPGFIFLIIGGLVWLVGSIGVLFGRLLQSSISRQREFLADASAVQFTRNPNGIANALRKLGSGGARGRMVHFREDCAHMMFSSLHAFRLTNLFATHPPLAQRIRRILPDWDGTWLEASSSPSPSAPPPAPPPPPAAPFVRPLAPQAATTPVALLNVLEGDGLSSRERLQAAQAWRQSLPEPILAAARDPFRAPALVYLLLLQPETLDHQLAILRQQESPHVLEALEALRARVTIDPADRLPVLDLALPALRQMNSARRIDFLARVDDLVRADGRVDLFEYALHHVLRHALEDAGGLRERRPRVPMSAVRVEVNVVLSILARLGAENEEQAEKFFEAARQRLLGYTAGIELRLLPPRACGLEALDKALTTLRDLAPAFQQRLLLAGLAAISHDGVIQPAELEAFRAVTAALHIPAPPDLGFQSRNHSSV